MQIDTDLVRTLAELLDANALTEIEVEDGHRRVRVARKAGGQTVVQQPGFAQTVATAAPVAAVAPPPAPAPAEDEGEAVRSPMVGTCYLAPEPGAKPFISIGDTVKEGQTLVIIEAMKVMNAIPAPRAGKVTKICIENGQPVEYDQSLVLID